MPRPEPPEHRRILSVTLPRLAGARYQVERDVLTWLIAGLESNKSGARYVRPMSIADDLGRTAHGVKKAIATLANLGLLHADPESGHVWVPDCILANPVQNPSHATHYRNELARLGSSLVLTKALDLVQSQLDTVSKTVLDTVPNTVPNTVSVTVSDTSDQRTVNSNQETAYRNRTFTPAPAAPAPTGLLVDVPVEKVKRKPKAKAPDLADNPPTIEETIALFVHEGCPEADADRIGRGCHGHWESKGWKRGRDPIVSWAGTVRTWLSNQCERDRDLANAVRTSRLPEWQKRGFNSEQAYLDHQTEVAQRRAARLEEEKRHRQVIADFGVGLKHKQEADDEEAEYRKNNPLPVWAFPAEPPEDEVLT